MIVNGPVMDSPARSYQQFCGLARALDVVGERWTLLIVRNLLLGPRRYGDLLAELPGITTNLLAKRLRHMAASGLVRKTTMPPPASFVAYELAPSGEALEPVVMELARWGGRFMDAPRPGDVFDVGWGLLSMKRRYRGGVDLLVELRIDERRFSLRMDASAVEVKERSADRPDLVVSGSLPAFRELFFSRAIARRDAATLRDDGVLVVEGTRAAFRDFARAFAPLPDVAAAR